jgi:hypothetical protein
VVNRISSALLVAAGLAFLPGCGLAPSTQTSATAVQALDGQAEALKAQFNRDKGKVRLLFIMDPKCATCLRGLADINRDLLSKAPAQTEVYVVHLPVVGGTQQHISGAASLIQNVKPRHYWDPQTTVGKQFTELLSLRSRGDPALAWDVWFAYGPDDQWGATPPKPRVAMHQLSPLDPHPNITYLDSKEFARRARELLPKEAKGAGS